MDNKKTINKKKFWNFIKNRGEAINSASNLLFSMKRITEIIINEKTNVSLSDKEL